MKRENQEEILGRHNHLWSVPLLQRESNRVNNYAIDTQGIGEICKLESVQATAKMMQEKLKAIIAEGKKK